MPDVFRWSKLLYDSGISHRVSTTVEIPNLALSFELSQGEADQLIWKHVPLASPVYLITFNRSVLPRTLPSFYPLHFCFLISFD